MKKWLYLIGALAAVGILSRLPHPARDIARLEPVRAVYIHMDAGRLSIETDTGDSGSGKDLTEATENLRSKADGEIFLDTAEFLILDPAVPIGEDFYTLLRPSCKVAFSESPPDLIAAADYLTIHTPKITLARLRAQRKGANHAEANQTAYPLAPGGSIGSAGPLFRLRLVLRASGSSCGVAAGPCAQVVGRNAQSAGADRASVARCCGGPAAEKQCSLLALG